MPDRFLIVDSPNLLKDDQNLIRHSIECPSDAAAYIRVVFLNRKHRQIPFASIFFVTGTEMFQEVL
jgi:hypothetical protein